MREYVMNGPYGDLGTGWPCFEGPERRRPFFSIEFDDVISRIRAPMARVRVMSGGGVLQHGLRGQYGGHPRQRQPKPV